MINRRISRRKIFFLTAAVSFLLSVLCFSCRNTDISFSGALDEIDLSTADGKYDSALSLLKRIIKQASSAYDYISIYKRYMLLDEKKDAENVLKKGLSMIPGNEELSALYTQMLLRENRIDDAYTVSECLSGTKYGSLYSEVVLKKYISDSNKISFFAEELYSVYYDAYTGSKNPQWLRNCAVMDMMQGKGDEAVSIVPDNFFTSEDAYFWALIMYDNGRFTDAVDYLDKAQKLSLYGKKVSPLAIVSLLSDSYLAMGQNERAETARDSFLGNIDIDKISGDKTGSLPVLLFDNAYSALQNNRLEDCRDYLLQIVTYWPDYVPGLMLYADFAYESSIKPAEDSLTQSVREAGMQSRDMKQFNSQPKIPVSDALYRLDTSYERTKNPLIYVKKYDIESKINKVPDTTEASAALYQMLEKNMLDTDSYPAVIASYALGKLMQLGLTQDAYNLFRRYIIKKYNFDASADFYDQVIKINRSMDLWECKYAAYFAAFGKKTAAALRLYEYIVWETGPDKSGNYISPYAGWDSSDNLAMIYSSLGKREKAVDLYSKAASYTSVHRQKAESLYRLGCIQLKQGNKTDAIRSFKYCVSLDPAHAKAQQVLRSLK